MRFGVFASILLHIAAFGAAFVFSLPSSWRPDLEAERYIPLELIREAELDLTTSVPAARPEPEPIDTPEPDLPEPEVEEAIPEPIARQEETPPQIESEPEAAEVEVVPEAPKEAPSVKPKKQEEELDLEALSQLIDKMQEEDSPTSQDAPSETVETADQARSAVGAGDRLTASDEAKMKAAIARCWRSAAIIGAPNPETLVVALEFELNRDGTLASPPRVANAMQINLSANRFWKVAEQAAVRAVIECAPYDFLDPDRYETWREMRLNFNPSEMVGF